MNGKFQVKKGENGSNPPSEIINLSPPRIPLAEPELPGGQVPLGSPFYIERPPIEERSCEEIRKAGALIRIKAPARCGKTS
ncbi:MAG TPA: AAA-like domain-containing protein, partial [Kamptonema sp.]|nr:AAA-like domain-containing protein [Kamptonema sp.]